MLQVLIEGTPLKSYKKQLPVFFMCRLKSVFTAAAIFYDFLEFHSTFIWKKISVTNFPFFKWIYHGYGYPLNAEQLKSAKRESFLLMLFAIEVI